MPTPHRRLPASGSSTPAPTRVGGTTLGAGNVISGNGTGVYLSDGTTGVQIEGNYIGVDTTGTAALGNYYYGVLIGGPSARPVLNTGGSANNTVGGTATGAANVISGNGADGYDVYITVAAGDGQRGRGQLHRHRRHRAPRAGHRPPTPSS